MSVDPQQIHSQQHIEIGTILQRDSGVIVQRWSARVIREQPNATRVHHDALLDHVPVLLIEIGRNLAESEENHGSHRSPARKHGEQRWQAGWSLAEVVRDYQILRLVLVDYLEETLERPLTGREAMAVGLALDEAITSSISSYNLHQQEAIRDSERQQAERRRQEAESRHHAEAEALRENSRRKDEFLATLGHELRNPLAPIRNAVQVLRLRVSDAQTVTWAGELLERQVVHMSRLVDELLDISRIGRGKMLLKREPVDLVQLVRATAEDYRTNFDTTGLKLQLHLPDKLVIVNGDATRLSQILRNLLTNAIKFTDPGGMVTVRLSNDSGARRAELSVQDTGIGVEPELQKHIFESFAQADGSVGRSRGGLGLGLALVKGFVELHQGSVRVASEGRGRGTTFVVTLPLADLKVLPAKSAAAPVAASRLRVLVIEDNPDAADSLNVLLELMGHDVSVAYAGVSGIETARLSRPDVVLCDLGLPGMSGYAIARALRQHTETAGIRLIAVSGYGTEADQQKCREAGFDLHLTKPFDPVELERVLAGPAAGSPPG
jgi:signal transduction histidine kinase/ActR/RegA family two-component response regulator